MLTCSYSVLTYYFWMKHSSTVKKDWIELYNLQMRSIELYKFCTQIGTMQHFGLTFFTYAVLFMSYLIWENRQHFTMPPLVSPQKLMTKKTPYWWCITAQLWAMLLIGLLHPIRSTTQICIMHHQHGISVVVSQTSFDRETSVGVAKCCLFSQITSYHTDLIFNDATWWQLQSQEC